MNNENLDVTSTTLPGCRIATQREYVLGSGCGSVGRTGASNSRGPEFESDHGALHYTIK